VFDLAFAKQKGFAETRLAAASHRLAMLLNGAGMVRDGCPGQNAHETIPGLVVQPRSPAAAQTLSRGMQDVDHSSRTTGAAGSHPTALIFPLNGILRTASFTARSPDSPKGTQAMRFHGGVENLQTKTIVNLDG
jgi:hypothetical protein